MNGKELKSPLQLFEGRKVRTVWNEEVQEWFFSVVDVVAVLTDSADPKQYIKKMRARDPELNVRWGTICTPTRMMASDGKYYNTQAADMQGMFRIIQSIPSPKAEPFKQWMAQVAAQRIDQMLDPELSIDQAVADYRRLGYSESWINQRLKTIEIRKGLTKESLRDNMTNMELLLNALAEETATQLSKERNPDGLVENAAMAKEGAEVARDARKNVEKRLGRIVISSERAIDHTNPSDSLSLNEPGDFGDNEDIL